MTTSNIENRLDEMADELVELFQDTLVQKLRVRLGLPEAKPEPRRRPKHKKEPRRRGRPPRAKLSTREQDVYELLKKSGPLQSTAIADKLGVTQAAINRHLSSMASKKVIKKVRDGRTFYYQPR